MTALALSLTILGLVLITALLAALRPPRAKHHRSRRRRDTPRLAAASIAGGVS